MAKPLHLHVLHIRRKAEMLTGYGGVNTRWGLGGYGVSTLAKVILSLSKDDFCGFMAKNPLEITLRRLG